MKVSRQGYKKDSPDKFNPANLIPSGDITMKGVEHPVMMFPENDSPVMGMPGEEYSFANSNFVVEVPVNNKKESGMNQNPMLRDKMRQILMKGMDKKTANELGMMTFPNGGELPSIDEINAWNQLLQGIQGDLKTKGEDFKYLDKKENFGYAKDYYSNFAKDKDFLKGVEYNDFVKKMQQYGNDVAADSRFQRTTGHNENMYSQNTSGNTANTATNNQGRSNAEGILGSYTVNAYIPTYNVAHGSNKGQASGRVQALYNPYDQQNPYSVVSNNMQINGQPVTNDQLMNHWNGSSPLNFDAPTNGVANTNTTPVQNTSTPTNTTTTGTANTNTTPTNTTPVNYGTGTTDQITPTVQSVTPTDNTVTNINEPSAVDVKSLWKIQDGKLVNVNAQQMYGRDQSYALSTQTVKKTNQGDRITDEGGTRYVIDDEGNAHLIEKQMGGASSAGDPLSHTYLNKTSNFVNWLKKTSYQKILTDAKEDLRMNAPNIVAEVYKQLGGPVDDQSFSPMDESSIPKYGAIYNSNPFTGQVNDDSMTSGLMTAQWGGEQDPNQQQQCTDEQKMDPASPCYDPTFTPGYVTTDTQGNQTTADQNYGTGTNTSTAVNPTMAPAPAYRPAPNNTQGNSISSPYKNGMNSADALISGMNFFSNLINKGNADQRKDLTARTHADKIFMKNRKIDRGSWTVNEGYIDPMNTVPTQFQGVDYSNPYFQMGGEMQMGSEYFMTDEQIQKLLDSGADIEFLD